MGRFVVLAVAVAGMLGASSHAASQQSPSAPGVRRGPAVETLAGFVSNEGQWDDEVLYFARLHGIEATLTRDAIVLMPQRDPEAAEPPPAPLVMRLPGSAAVEGVGILPTPHHFLLGSGTTSWVPGFAQVVYRDVVPGIDLVLRKGEEWFAYDVHVDAGADLADLELTFENASGATLDDGVLVLDTPSGRVEQHLGAAWEVDAPLGVHRPVASAFRLLAVEEAAARVGFQAPGRDRGRALVIDPSLAWATYVGGASQELVMDVDVAPSGAVYLAAKSSSTGPTTPGAFQTVKPAGSNAWVGKLSADGSMLEWATFLGGAATENVIGLHVDADGTVVTVGDTFSADFPTTPGSLQPVFAGGNNDLFASRISADGSALVWSTFYGGPSFELSKSSALLSSGDVLISASPNAAAPPSTPGAYDTVFETNDQLVVRLSADGSSVVFQTYFDSGNLYLALGPDESIYMAGSAGANLPTTPGAFKEAMTQGDPSDGFAARMDAMGTTLHWATYFGGNALSETVPGIAVDAAGAVYLAGLTTSSDFPVTAGAFDTVADAPAGGFVTKFLPSGTGLAWSTYIEACCAGGSGQLFDIAVDRAGNAVAVGSSNAPNFPTTPDAFQPQYSGSAGTADAHITKFDAFGEALVYSTYFGGSGTDYVPIVALDAAGDPCMALRSGSNNIPVTPGAFDPTYGGGTDIVVAKFDLELAPWQVLGGALAGGLHTPNLAGAGALTTGSPARFSVRGGPPLATASLIAGVTALNAPLKGGTLVPALHVVLPAFTSALGELDLAFAWPGVPTGLDLWVQVWFKDVSAPTGFAATNALKLTAQ